MTPQLAQTGDESETARVLLARLGSKLGGIDARSVVDIVLRACTGTDFSVASAATDEVIDRYGQIREHELEVLARPSRLGVWKIGSAAGGPYEVLVQDIAPITVSCSCADFARNSLGICAHALFALEQAGTPAGHAGSSGPVTPGLRGRLVWDPIWPVRGEFDRLLRLRLVGQPPSALPGFRADQPMRHALLHLRSRDALLWALAQAIESGSLDAEPAARTVVFEELQRVESRRAAQVPSIRARRALESLRRQLHPHQRDFVLRFLTQGTLLLADDMGLGKTTQAAAACHVLLRTGEVRRVLVVVPNSLKRQWAREWGATTDEPLVVVDGNPERRAAVYAKTVRGALVVGYEQLLRDVELIRDWAPEVVVLDEAQRIKNSGTKSASAVKSLSPRYRLALTGTPLENRLSELVSVMDFIDDLALGPSWRVAPFHTYDEGDAGEGRSGARDLDLLRQRLAPVMMRRRRGEVSVDIPARTDHCISVEMSLDQRTEHDALDRPIAMLLQEANRRSLRLAEQQRLLNLLAKQRSISNGLALGFFADFWDDIAKSKPTAELLESVAPKLALLRALVTDVVLEQKRKVVVFSEWRRMLRLGEWAIRDLLAVEGQRAAFFTGAENSKQRERALVDFHDDPNVTALFMTSAGGVGLNLQHAASACVQLEVAWNPAVLEQRVARIHRPGQREPVDVYHLISEGGIESRITNLVGRKRQLFAALLDGEASDVQFDGNAAFLGTMQELYGSATSAPANDSTFDVDEPARPTMPELVPVTTGEADTPLGGEPVEGAPYLITRRPDGGLSIDVPPEMAESLAGILASLADAIRLQARAA